MECLGGNELVILLMSLNKPMQRREIINLKFIDLSYLPTPPLGQDMTQCQFL